MEIIDFLKNIFSGDISVKKEEFDELKLKLNESILLHNYRYGIKTWEGQIKDFEKESFSIVFRNVESNELPFAKGDVTRTSVMREDHVVSLYGKLLSVQQESRFSGYTISYPTDVDWKKMKSRRHVRVKTDLSGRAREPGFDLDKDNWADVKVKDISESGLCILSPRPFNRDRKIFVNVVSSEISQWFRGSITRVDVLDIRAEKGTMNYNIGVEFDKLSPHDDEMLADYIKGKYQTLSPDLPFNM